jgi:hypothetical protein
MEISFSLLARPIKLAACAGGRSWVGVVFQTDRLPKNRAIEQLSNCDIGRLRVQGNITLRRASPITKLPDDSIILTAYA